MRILKDVVANVRWWPLDVRDRRPASHRRVHHRPRWKRVGPEHQLPSGPLSHLPFFLFLIHLCYFFFNSIRSGCFSYLIFFFLFFWNNFLIFFYWFMSWIDPFDSVCFLGKKIPGKCFIPWSVSFLIVFFRGSVYLCTSAIHFDEINEIWFAIYNFMYRFWFWIRIFFREIRLSSVWLQRKALDWTRNYWILWFFFLPLYIVLVSDK